MNSIEPPSQKLVQVVEAGFSGATLTYILIIVFLLFISALMSASESAFFSLSPADNEDLKKNNPEDE
jgi:archaellum component FlaF (FlaF/FlaG flagellin family)